VNAELRPWHFFVLVPLTGLTWLWMYWVDRLLKTAPNEPNFTTGQTWEIELRGPTEAYVTRAEYLTYNLSWIGFAALAIVGLFLVPLYVRIFRPARWRELMRGDEA